MPSRRTLRPLVSRTVLLAAAAVAACATPGTGPEPLAVVSDLASPTALAGARSYSWVLDPARDVATGIINNNSQFAPVIQAAVERELGARGYRKANPGAAPDFWMAALSVNRDAVSQVIGDRYFGDLGLRDVPSRFTSPPLDAPADETVTLVLDARAPWPSAVAWRASVTAAVDRSAAADERLQRLNALVDDLMRGFPKASG
jgi:hypothetical protein